MTRTFLYKLKIALAIPTSKWGKKLSAIISNTPPPKIDSQEALRHRLKKIKTQAVLRYGADAFKRRSQS